MLNGMKIESILAELDAEIARLTQVRKLLAGYGSSATVKAKAATKASAKGRKKHVLSAEARKRIAEAQKRRWAAQKAKK
jgi:hypothetical protein